MALEQLERLVHDAETQPALRQQLRGCTTWQALIAEATLLGYAITRADLQQASQEEAASRFLENSRIGAVRDLMGAVPGRRPQLSWRRLASTAR